VTGVNTIAAWPTPRQQLLSPSSHASPKADPAERLPAQCSPDDSLHCKLQARPPRLGADVGDDAHDRLHEVLVLAALWRPERGKQRGQQRLQQRLQLRHRVPRLAALLRGAGGAASRGAQLRRTASRLPAGCVRCTSRPFPTGGMQPMLSLPQDSVSSARGRTALLPRSSGAPPHRHASCRPGAGPSAVRPAAAGAPSA